MSWAPITPARIDFSDPAAPVAPDYGDLYHSRAGAPGQARHVFLAGNELPQRWAGRSDFAILEAGFGLGHNFVQTWAAWRDDPRRPARLHYLAIERHPPQRADLARSLGATEPALAAELLARWPVLTPDLHALELAGGRVRLLLAFGDASRVLTELTGSFDAFYLDGFAPARNPAMWSPQLLRGLHRLAAPGATLATWCSATAVRAALATAGFEVAKAPGFAAKREMTVARFAPRVAPRPPPGRAATPARTVAVIGAGLAGAAAARALAARGVAVQLFERRTAPATETSGQPGGLLHGVVHAADGPYARWLRAAALHAARDLAPRLAAQRVPGELGGVWRAEKRADLAALHAQLQRLALPADYVQAVALADGSVGWWFPGGGWTRAAALVEDWLRDAAIELRCDAAVHALQAGDAGWQLHDARGASLATVDAVVLANACDLPRLWPGAAPWLGAQLAQTSWLPGDAAQPPLAHPIADAGYALRLADGRLLFGAAATTVAELAQADALNRGDPAATVSGHRRNLATLARLTGWQRDAPPDAAGELAPAAAPQPAELGGRSGVKLRTTDRLPLVGALPAAALPAHARLDQPRLVPRAHGLLVLGALGSRGLAQAALAGEIVAAWMTGTPLPVPAGVLDAIDPARFIARAVRARARL